MRKLLLTLISVVALAALVGCGGGSSSNNNVSVPSAPSGGLHVGFSNSSLHGNYVFSVHGFNSSSSFAVSGLFTADGSGNISSGIRDTVNDAGGQNLGESITGTYAVNSDGRGLAILNGSSGQSIYFLVLSSPSAGQLFQDGTGSNSIAADAVGKLELQTSTSTALSGTYVVRLDGEDSNKFPYGAVGGLTASGATLTGSIDENDAGTFSSQLAISSGTYTLSSNGRGTATYTTPAGPNTGAHNFIVYYVSPSELELISTDKKFFLYGHADQQLSGVGTLSGNQVFKISGFDNSGPSGSGYPIVETGRFSPSGGVLSSSSSIMDYNAQSSFYSPTFTGSYSVTSSGRWAASLSNFSIGPLVNENLVGWQVSPQQSEVLVTYGSNSTLGTNYTVVATGDVQSQNVGLSNASVTGYYSQFFSGYDTGLGNFESTGGYQADGSGSLNGTIDFQTDSQGLAQNVAESGETYSVDPILGRGTATVSGVPVFFYTGITSVLNNDTIYLISSDASSAYQGTLTLQQP